MIDFSHEDKKHISTNLNFLVAFYFIERRWITFIQSRRMTVYE